MPKKLTQEVIEAIVNLLQSGKTSRKIAQQVGVCKSSVNNYRKTNNKKQISTTSKRPRILLFDLETAPSIAAVFGRFKQNIIPAAIVSEGGWIISLSYKWLGEDKIETVSVGPDEAKQHNDLELVKLLYDLFEEADIVVAHNGDSFDIPTFRSRLAIHSLPMHKKVRTVDTLKVARNLRFNSNKLDELGKYLDLGRKVEHRGITLWLECMEGRHKSLSEMREYNERDIELLEAVYKELRKFDPRTVNINVFFEDEFARCPTCGSSNLKATGGTVTTNLSTFHEYLCSDCGSRSRSRKALKVTRNQVRP